MGLFSWGRAASVAAPEYPLLSGPIENSKGIPLRLTIEERKALHLVRAIMGASDYTDIVDSPAILQKGPGQRKMRILRELSRLITGTNVAIRAFEEGEEIERKLGRYSTFSSDRSTGFQDMHFIESNMSPIEKLARVFGLARQYKRINPDLLRTDYLKFLYMLQDAVLLPEAREQIGGEILAEPLTVSQTLKEIGANGVLSEETLPLCITPVPFYPNVSELNAALDHKRKALRRILGKYSSDVFSRDVLEHVIYSLADANDFSLTNDRALDQIINLLKQYFSPSLENQESFDKERQSLEIREGVDGSRLTHNHERQFRYVLQTLTLWKNVTKELWRLWAIAEEDMLDPLNPYELRETGQGFHRVQPAPRLLQAAQEILDKTKSELKDWIGLERIHMGDSQVPNAFYFIDKYSQVSRVVVPVVRVLEALDKPKPMPGLRNYVARVYKTNDNATRYILADFFCHAFDGSGADNFYDAGSCIDGRLTSAWNWCNQLSHKPFYPVFMLAGFTEFDGDLGL